MFCSNSKYTVIKLNLLPEYQSACRIHHSCDTSLIKIINDILYLMENRQVTALTAIYLSVTFDTMDHRFLLDALYKQFNLEGNALN